MKVVAYSWLLLHRLIGGSLSLPAVMSEKPRLDLVACGLVMKDELVKMVFLHPNTTGRRLVALRSGI